MPKLPKMLKKKPGPKIPGAVYYGDNDEYFHITLPASPSRMNHTLQQRDLRAVLSKNTVYELRIIAKYLQLSGYSKLRKAALVSLIKQALKK